MLPNDAPPLDAPLAQLERDLMQAYVAGAGQDLGALLRRHDNASRELLAAASAYASAKLCEVESRSHYLHELHRGS